MSKSGTTIDVGDGYSVDPETGEISPTELALTVDLSGATAPIPPPALIAKIISRLPNGRLSMKHLARVVTPAKGAPWTLPSLSGPVEVGKALRGVVLGTAVNRAYWSAPLGTGQPNPDCWSADGITGVGEPGGRCTACPLSQWGSNPDSRGQACREFRSLLVYPVIEGIRRQVLPTVIRISPASIDAWDSYAVMLAANGLTPEQVVSEFSLVTAVSRSGGIEYAGVAFSMVEQLEDALADWASDLWTTLATAIDSQRIAAEIEQISTAPEPLPVETYIGLDGVA